MNKLYAAVILMGFINLAVLIVEIAIIYEFKDFKELCDIWRKMKKADHRSIQNHGNIVRKTIPYI